MKQWHRIGFTAVTGILMAVILLAFLWTNAQAGFIGGGPGGCGEFAPAVAEAQDGDTIIQMTGEKDATAVVITKNLRVSGGWARTPTSCDDENQVFTEAVDVADFGFSYNAPAERSELKSSGDSVLILEDPQDPDYPNLDKLILEHLILDSSLSPEKGGGISGIISGAGEVLLDNIRIEFSRADDSSGDPDAGYGGGLHLWMHQNATLTIEDSEFDGNEADVDGGGLYIELYDNARLTIDNTWFHDNTAVNGGGLEIHVHDDSEVIIRDSVFDDNANRFFDGTGAAAQIYTYGNGRVTFHHVTFTGNNGGYDGDGIYAVMDGGALIIRNSVFSNTFGADSDLYVTSTGSSSADVEIYNTTFTDDNPGTIQFVQTGTGSLNNRIYNNMTYLPITLNGSTVSTFKRAEIISITQDADFNYIVDFEVYNFVPDTSDFHVHFFFDTVPPDEAGVPAPSSNWILYGGASPFTQYSFSDRPDGPYGAEKMCVLVANSRHEVLADTGNCVKLP